MKSNTFFSFSRFYLLLRNDILINYKKYLFMVLGAFVVGYIVLYWQMPKVDSIYPDFKADNYTPIFFKRFALVKTIISLVALSAIFWCIMVVFSHLFYPEIIGFTVYFNSYYLTTDITNFLIWICSISFLSWLFFLPLGYFKLKEKQV